MSTSSHTRDDQVSTQFGDAFMSLRAFQMSEPLASLVFDKWTLQSLIWNQ